MSSLLIAAAPVSASSATGKNFTLPAATKTSYSIYGTVRTSSLSAVADVEVSAYNTTSYGDYKYGYATTNSGGVYHIDHLLPGSYTLSFDPPRSANLQRGWRTATAPTYFTVSESSAVAVTITTASLTGKDIRLPAGYKISGKVTRSNGTTAIVGADVSGEGTYAGDYTTTSSTGTFTLQGLSPGSYTVSFGHDATDSNQTGCWYTTPSSKFSASCASHTAVLITTANITGINPKIPNGLAITGYVKTQAAVPISGADIWADGPESNYGYTDATGKYTVKGLNPGAYKIEVDGPYASRVPDGYYTSTAPYHWSRFTASASSLTISAASTTVATIEPPTGYYIKGKITDTSTTPKPVSDVEVYAIGGSGTAATHPSDYTDSSGNYAIGPLPPGNLYKVQANPDYFSSDPTLQTGWYKVSAPNNFTTSSASAYVLTMTGDKTAINMRLPKGASISGTVTFGASATACADCYVDAIDSTGSEVQFTFTSSSGAYKLTGFSAGSYRVEAYDYSYIIDATHVRIITSGFYKSGVTGNFTSSASSATAIAVSP